jgi:hypothetical protein
MTDEGFGRSLEQEPEGALRDRPPDPLAPIDPDAPVSGHVAPPPSAVSTADSPEHDWGSARPNLYPVLRPAGSPGQPVDEPIDPSSGHAHTQPLVSVGPCELVISYALAGPGFDILVNGDHLLSWGVGPDELAEAALANLAAWSERAGWSDEISGQRRLLSSDNGDGQDAARILLPEVRRHLQRELAGDGEAGTDGTGIRVLVGLPERDLLIAGALRPDDPEFASLFRDFIVEHSGDAEEPIDRRVFELADGELIEFRG